MNDTPGSERSTVPRPAEAHSPANTPHVELMQQMTVYICETDHLDHKPLYLRILEVVKSNDGAGATVLRGIAGYRASSHSFFTAGFADIHQNLPLVIVIVDAAAQIERMLPEIEHMIEPGGGLITVQDLEAHRYIHPSRNRRK